MLNRYRPRAVTEQPSAALIRASGKCAECHANLQYAVVHEYELSVHNQRRVNCLECHQPAGSRCTSSPPVSGSPSPATPPPDTPAPRAAGH
jgi:hypothetical protein